jgi:signal-transduction protein with cAMP-binding, CBS, and nucleotidyltransferase domain
MELGDMATTPALEVAPESPIREVAAAMHDANASCALVGADALVTERDLTRAWAAGAAATDPVETIATVHPFTVEESVPTVEAAALMLNQGIRHLVVRRSDGSRAVISLAEVVCVLLDAARAPGLPAHVDVRFVDHSELWLG